MKRLQVSNIPPEPLLVACSVVAAVWGVLAAAAAGPAVNALVRHGGEVLLAAAICALIARADFSVYERISGIAAGAACAALAAVLLAGAETNGMRGWFSLGPATIQPSEIAKPVFLLAVTGMFLSRRGGRRRNGLLLCGVFFILLALEPDFGTLAVYAGGAFFAAFMARIEIKRLLTAFALTLGGAAALAAACRYAAVRISQYVNPGAIAESPWHWRQMQIAIARGGWRGTGGDSAWWSGEYLPLAGNDSVYSLISEGAGIGGAAAITILWLLWLRAAFRMAEQAETPRRQLFIASCGAMTAIQAGIHIAANSGLLPITGLNLPLISSGGSSLVSCGIMIGMMLSASRGVSQ